MPKIACPHCSGTGKCDAPEQGSLGEVLNRMDAREIVFKAWAVGQRMPERCRMGAAAVKLIDAALGNASAADLCALFDYAYNADEPGAKFWRGESVPGVKGPRYLGLDNLLVTSKLAGRVSEALFWKSRRPAVAALPGAPVMGDLAAFRAAPWGTPPTAAPVPVPSPPPTVTPAPTPPTARVRRREG